jgi:hypothetical protein
MFKGEKGWREIQVDGDNMLIGENNNTFLRTW